MQRFFPKRYYIWKPYPLPPIITTNRNTYYFSYIPPSILFPVESRRIYKYTEARMEKIVTLDEIDSLENRCGERERELLSIEAKSSFAVYRGRRPSRTHCSIMQCRLNRGAEARFHGGHIPRRSVVLAPAYHRPANRGE